MERPYLAPIVTTLLVWILISCAPVATPVSTPTSPEPTSPPQVQVQFDLSSSAFPANQPIPVRYACHGEDLSPPLTWSKPPAGTQSFALIMDDPDAVNVAGFVWDHWLIYNLPPNILSLPEGIPPDSELPDGSRHGKNSFKRLGYGGPCPPSGHTHSYVFTLYALDTLLDLETGAGKDEIFEAMNTHILGQAELTGLYTSP